MLLMNILGQISITFVTNAIALQKQKSATLPNAETLVCYMGRKDCAMIAQ
jgi:hypothetical protein